MAKGKSLLPEPKNPFVYESSALLWETQEEEEPIGVEGSDEGVYTGLGQKSHSNGLVERATELRSQVEARGGKSAEVAVLPLNEKTKIRWHLASEYTVWNQTIGGS